jgi:MerR family transcriptional regulator/heat shock protein HspR
MAGKKKEGVYVISVAARLADMHPQTLRLYERKGLVSPQRTPKNRRFYSDEDINRLKRIQELTQGEGLNLSGVRKVLAMESEITDLRGKVLALEKELKEARIRVKQEAEGIRKQFALSKKPPEVMAVFRKKRRKR